MKPTSGPPHLVSYSKLLDCWPGSKHGQWPQTNLRLFIDDKTNDILVSVDRVVIKTRAVIGGPPERLIRKAICRNDGYTMGTPKIDDTR